MENLTAMVSCFARAYHFKNNRTHIFADPAAESLLGDDYALIARSMTQGLGFFLPDFDGSPEEGLRLIVDRQLSPSVLGRSAFCEDALRRSGCGQYVIFASGYDTFALRNTAPTVYELDLPELISDKIRRINAVGLHSSAVFVPCDLSNGTWQQALPDKGFCAQEASFGSLLGISYYLTKNEFATLLHSVGDIMTAGSSICLDFPCKADSEQTRINRTLAEGAGEAMKAQYSLPEMQSLLSDCGFKVEQYLDHTAMTERYFTEYNRQVPQHPMTAPAGVGYLLAVR